MTTKNNIPTGYKDSAVGVVPKDWKVYDFRDIASISKEKYTPSDSSCMPCVELEHISRGDGVLLGSTEARLQKSTKNVFKKGCVLFGKLRPYLRKYLHVDFDGVCSSEIWVLSANENICSNEYLYRLVSSDKYIQCANVSIGSKMPRADWNFVSITLFPVPPMEEQRKIAEILGAWDEAIEKQSRLIEKLELRKRALMQRLLTGRTRLPGFTTPWQKRRMKDCFEHITDTSNGCEYLPMTISARLGLISQKDKFDRVIAGDSLKKYTHIQKGDFAYNKGNSNLYEMGCIYRLKEQDAVVPFVYICFRPKQNVIGEFYQHFFINHGLDRQLKRIITSGARGDGLLNVDKTDFFELEIVYPPIAEQKAIAAVLTAADNEIATHRKRLEALRLQKRGLMQQLLTGKTRVKI